MAWVWQNPAGSASDPANRLIVTWSNSSTVEEDAFMGFNIGISDKQGGAIASAGIDITGISAVLSKSTGGGAFSAVGITQPTFTKANGSVSVNYRFLAAQWVTGDVYKLVVSGITATIDTDTAYIPTVTWGSIVLEAADIDANVTALLADLGDASASTKGSIYGILGNPGTDTFLALLGQLATAANTGDPGSVTQQALLKQIVNVLRGADGLATWPGAAVPANNVSMAEVIQQLYNDLVLALADIGNASGATLGSLLGIVGDPGTDSLAAVLGQLATAEAAGPVTTADSLMAYLKQIISYTEAQKAGTGVFYEQADVAFTNNAVSGSETDVFDLNTASTRYMVRSLYLKAVDPGVDTITVRLYELVNDVSVEVDSFDITTANFGDYHSLMDMFGLAQLAGDDLQVTIKTDANTYAVTGQYSHAKTTN